MLTKEPPNIVAIRRRLDALRPYVLKASENALTPDEAALLSIRSDSKWGLLLFPLSTPLAGSPIVASLTARPALRQLAIAKLLTAAENVEAGLASTNPSIIFAIGVIRAPGFLRLGILVVGFELDLPADDGIDVTLGGAAIDAA
jgi:hypothetical protein